MDRSDSLRLAHSSSLSGPPGGERLSPSADLRARRLCFCELDLLGLPPRRRGPSPRALHHYRLQHRGR
eukprot:13701298-Alexandrium_andersonii.AAC.1